MTEWKWEFHVSYNADLHSSQNKKNKGDWLTLSPSLTLAGLFFSVIGIPIQKIKVEISHTHICDACRYVK